MQLMNLHMPLHIACWRYFRRCALPMIAMQPVPIIVDDLLLDLELKEGGACT